MSHDISLRLKGVCVVSRLRLVRFAKRGMAAHAAPERSSTYRGRPLPVTRHAQQAATTRSPSVIGVT